jgi:dipeptidyl aminopeptidase/acylaminoacyl peptidase
MQKITTLVFIFISSFSFSQTLLEQFLTHPTESGFVASKDGKNLAWVLNDRGKRNIVVKLGTELPKLITDYQQDDGQEITQLAFSPNGLKLLFVRGGAPNRAGQHPNPASLAEGAEQWIYFKDVGTKSAPAKIVAGSSPLFFRDGLKFLFAKGGQIFESTLEINAVPKPLFLARGHNYHPQFSPSGNEVLFISDRGDHSFVGVYSLISKTIKWVAPDITRDDLAAWSPDGKSVAFVRTPGVKIGELENFTNGTPFSIVVAEVESNLTKVIWKSPAADGGFSQGYSATPLAWVSANRILFHSEHTGWNHVFSINPDGSDLKDITPGDGEVESFVVDPAGQQIYFDGNREDINRRHIWKSNVISGNPVAVTSGDGIEMYPTFGGNELYCLKSTFNTAKVMARVDEAKKATVPLFPQKLVAFSSALFAKPEAVTFKAPDGTLIHGQLFINRSIPNKKAGIVYMHGGPTRQMLLGFHYSDYYSNAYAFNQLLANQGYVVLSVNFRNGIGYGRDFRMTKNQGPRGATEYQDIVAAGKYLQTLPEVESTKIGLWGGSYGGYLTAMGLARNPELFKAGVDVHGVHDWSFDGQDATNGWGLQKSESDLAKKSSPIADLSKWTGPVLMVHGDDDRNVNFQQTVDLVEKLRAKNVPLELLVLPDEVHGFLRYDSWSRIFTASKDFFDRKLK